MTRSVLRVNIHFMLARPCDFMESMLSLSGYHPEKVLMCMCRK